MNKLRIDISSPVAQQLAKIALFERIQVAFNLRPGKMAADMTSLAKRQQRRPGLLLLQVMPAARDLLEETLQLTELIVKNKPLPNPRRHGEFEKMVLRYFKLNPQRIAKDLIRTAAAHGFSAVSAIEYLRPQCKEVMRLAFVETERIIYKNAKKTAS
jgi:hypothetical protein